jgi:probable F420-dependent oxidoreductase
VAVATERVELGTSVLIVPYRNPLVLAKMLSTIDQLSRGRVRLGIGVGWMEEEFEALGIGEWYRVRGRVTDEWIAICRRLWSDQDPVSFDGRFISFKKVGGRPTPVNGRIPIWVGGWGDVAARRVARLGDGYQTISSSPALWPNSWTWCGRSWRSGGARFERSRSRCSAASGLASRRPPALRR